MSAVSLRVVEREPMDKSKALDAALGQIEKAFGKGSIMRLGQRDMAVEAEVVSTGSLGLDIALGIGGLPRGRIVEIYGPESSGKTTLALHAIAEAQRAGGTCAFVDAEHALDPSYARKLGVNIDELLISQPDAGEQALEIADTLVRSGAIEVLVIDSVAALVPRAELEGEMGDSHVGLQARLMSQALRKLTSSISKSHCLVIFINQIRLKIGVMFGNPETTTGGNALKFYASVRLDIRRTGSIKKGGEVIGNETREQMAEQEGRLPDSLIAAIGGGSNAIGLFHPFLDDDSVRIIGVEAAGHGIESGEHCASLKGGQPGVLHGNRTYLLQDAEGQIKDGYSISAGLDYPGIGPEHAWLRDIGRVEYVSATDLEALEAFKLCTANEGIIPALEPCHALAYVAKIAPDLPKDHLLVMNMCGRGDKDIFAVAERFGFDM